MTTALETACADAPVAERIIRIRRRYQSGDAWISVERARLYTEHWRSTERSAVARPVRVAQTMKHVYENMTVYLDPDDRIAGTWTEAFLGLPIPIERGEYNSVLEAELTRPRMLAHRLRSAARATAYMARKGALGEFVRNQRITRAQGAPPLNMGVRTMSRREINPFKIRDEDRRVLLSDLLPYWRGRCLVDVLERELARAGLYSEDMHDFVAAIPGNTSRQVFMLSACATIASIQGHVILDYGRVLRDGLDGILDEIRSRLSDAAALSADETAFLRSVEIAVEGVTVFARRLADRIAGELARETDAERKATLAEMLAACRAVPFRPAETFAEAVQSAWTVKTAVEIAHPVNLHCFGRLDQDFIDCYRRDLAAGRTTREAARELLEELLLKIQSQNMRPESNVLGRFYHRFLGSSPVTVGGLTPDGEDGTNELTELFVEAADRSRAVTNLAVRVHAKTPDELLHRVADCLERGASSYSLFSDETSINAMVRRGFAERDARDYAVMGCVETTCPGRTGSMSANALQLARLLDITLRGGDARTLAGTIREEGLRIGGPDAFADFDALLAALFAQGRYFVEKIARGSNLRDRLYAERLPAPHISAFIDGCLESGRDVTRGGARYDLAGVSMINSIANLVDSLHAIRALVFEQKRFTIGELLAAVDDNFVGHEAVARALDELPGKWGNGEPATDALAHDVMKALFAETYRHRTFKGAPFVVYVISMITHTIDGRLSIAGPDGRRAATPFAASCNPYNVDRAGATGALRSVAALPFEDVMGCAVNVRFHPTAIGRTRASRGKWVALIRTYFGIGGAQIQPTVVGTEMLREAQADPDRHRDLIVKVGGYSTYFVDLGREIQDEVIARTEHR